MSTTVNGNQAPYFGPSTVIDGTYTGYNINATAGSRTAWNQDLLLGHAIQLDPHDHATSTTADKERGKTYAQVTAGQKGPFGTVVAFNSESVNKQSGAVANLRDGGSVQLAVRGEAYAIVYANATAGTTMLAPDTSGRLIATDESVPALNIGATARRYAIALETADTSSTAALKRVYIVQ